MSDPKVTRFALSGEGAGKFVTRAPGWLCRPGALLLGQSSGQHAECTRDKIPHYNNEIIIESYSDSEIIRSVTDFRDFGQHVSIDNNHPPLFACNNAQIGPQRQLPVDLFAAHPREMRKVGLVQVVTQP